MSEGPRDETRTLGGGSDHSASPSGLVAVPGYEVLRLIGEGGMGTVYEAIQLSPRRRVALKLIRESSSQNPVRRQLFEREVRMLARLNHPGIATIHESGATADGRLFFTMEFIEGETLQMYVRRTRPSRDELLRLIAETAGPVAYAHQQGIIHRDLKPSNIMVASGSGGTRIVKVLDFGLARPVEPGETTQVTETGDLRGTLQYMSPEQIRDPANVDTRSDQYTLGVIAYELLCGRMPYSFGSGGLMEATKAILESGAEPTGLDQDLDTILRKVLQKEPDGRYASVAEFAADLERYRAGLPVLAHPPSTLYQIRKLIVRHRAVAALLALVAMLTVVTLAGLVIFNRRLAAARDAAAREARTAEQVTRFLTAIFESSDLRQGNRGDTPVRKVVEEGASRMEAELAGQPEIAARLSEKLGGIFKSFGDYERAERLLRSALEKRQRLHGADSPQAAEAMADLGDVYRESGRLPQAREWLEKALGILKTVEPRTLAYAVAANNYGLTLDRAGESPKGVPYIREAYEIRKAGLGAKHPDTILTLSNLGQVESRAGRHEEGISQMREAVELSRAVLGPDHYLVGVRLLNLSVAVRRVERYDEGEKLIREAMANFARSVPLGHELSVGAEQELASLYYQRGRYSEALPLYEKGLRHDIAKFGEDSMDTAISLNNYASALQNVGRLDEARQYMLRSIAAREKVAGPKADTTLLAMANLLRLEYQARRFAKVVALADDLAARTEDPRVLVPIRVYRGLSLAQSGRQREGEKLAREAMEEARTRFGSQKGALRRLEQVMEAYDRRGG